MVYLLEKSTWNLFRYSAVIQASYNINVDRLYFFSFRLDVANLTLCLPHPNITFSGSSLFSFSYCPDLLTYERGVAEWCTPLSGGNLIYSMTIKFIFFLYNASWYSTNNKYDSTKNIASSLIVKLKSYRFICSIVINTLININIVSKNLLFISKGFAPISVFLLIFLQMNRNEVV